MRCACNSALAVLVVAILTTRTANSHAQEQPSLTAQDLVAKIQESEKRIKDVQAKLTIYADTLPDPAVPFQEIDWGYQAGMEFYKGIERLKAEGSPTLIESDVHYTFDGQKMFIHRQQKSTSYDGGAIRPLDPTVFSVELTPNTMMGSIARSNGRSLLGDTLSQAKTISLKQGQEIINGKPCLVIEATATDVYPGFIYNTRAWIDPSLDYRPVRVETYYQKFENHPWVVPHQRVEVTKFENVDGIWIPTEGIRYAFTFDGFDPPAGMSEEEFIALSPERQAAIGKVKLEESPPHFRVSVDTNSIRLNKGIALESFRISFPRGCRVWDEFLRLGYRVGAKEDSSLGDAHSMEATSQADSLPAGRLGNSGAQADGTKEAATSANGTSPNAGHYNTYLVVAGLVILCGCACLWIYRRRRA